MASYGGEISYASCNGAKVALWLFLLRGHINGSESLMLCYFRWIIICPTCGKTQDSKTHQEKISQPTHVTTTEQTLPYSSDAHHGLFTIMRFVPRSFFCFFDFVWGYVAQFLVHHNTLVTPLLILDAARLSSTAPCLSRFTCCTTQHFEGRGA